MDDILELKCSQIYKGPKFGTSQVYLWSDFHFNNPEIMLISKRSFYSESTVVPGLKIPAPDKMQKKIIMEIESLPNNSVLFNLGDLGRLSSEKDEQLLIDINNKLHKKGIKHFLILGNHDFLKDNLVYAACAGNEIDFYKKLGFDEVFLNTVGCIIDNTPVFFSHKPLLSETLSYLIQCLSEFECIAKCDMGKNFHGHWHSHKNKSLRSRSVCIDMTEKPLLLGNEIEKEVSPETQLFLMNVSDNGFEADPW